MTEEAAPQDTFDKSWLALREPVDAAARSTMLAERLAGWVQARKDLRIVDLGAGTGSALRWLSPRLDRPQSWRLVDGDAGLLRAAAETSVREDVKVEIETADLARADLTRLVAGADILSASALLDLVSDAWIERLVAACRAADCAAWLTLSVSGRHDWDPAAPLDPKVGQAFAQDQTRDKGFGVALGPNAVESAASHFRKAGFDVAVTPSNWRLGPSDPALLTAFVEGYGDAAAAARPELEASIRDWTRHRLSQAAAGELRVLVGHDDILALPR